MAFYNDLHLSEKESSLMMSESYIYLWVKGEYFKLLGITGSHKIPPLDEELKASQGYWEMKNQSFPGMSSLNGYPVPSSQP